MEKKKFDKNEYPLQEETELVIRTGIEIHKTLGAGFLEIVYKEAFEYEYRSRDILYEREKEYIIKYKNAVLPHKFYADFVVFDKVIVEIKAKEGVLQRKAMLKPSIILNAPDAKLALFWTLAEWSLKLKELYFNLPQKHWDTENNSVFLCLWLINE